MSERDDWAYINELEAKLARQANDQLKLSELLAEKQSKLGACSWIATSDKLPPNGDLVFVCDFDQTELGKSFYAAWYANGVWRSRQVWTRKGVFVPRYWMPIMSLPDAPKP